MQCSYCRTDFHAKVVEGAFEFADPARLPGTTSSSNQFWNWHTQVCSKCYGAHIFVKIGQHTGLYQERIDEYRQVVPVAGSFDPAPVEVPATIAADYTEASLVLQISAKASAALARRCLQAILAAQGYAGKNLVNQVEAVLNEKDTTKALPTPIRENIDAIRSFGNFSAHPITDLTTLQVVEVEDGEAEWCLSILLDLFDHYYVGPARAAAKRAALASKLASAGNPPMKS